MKDKYIDERFPYWFSMTAGARDISDGDTVEFACAAGAQNAKEICARHNAVLDKLNALVQAFEAAAPEAFKEHWYEG